MTPQQCNMGTPTLMHTKGDPTKHLVHMHMYVHEFHSEGIHSAIVSPLLGFHWL